MRRILETLVPAAPLILLFVVWESAARLGWAPPNLLPAPSLVLQRLLELLPDGEFLHHLGQTLIRLLGGFAIAWWSA